MKHILSLILAVILMVSTGVAQEKQTITISKDKATPEQIALYEAEQAKTKVKETVQTVNNYVGVGKEVGTAVREGLSALNDEVNKFSESSAGKFTMFIITYKVLGKDAIRLAIGLPLWFAGTIFFMFTFYRNCVTRTVLDKVEDKVKTYKVINRSGEEPSSRSEINFSHLSFVRWGHFAAFMLFTGLMAIITIVGAN